LPGSGDGAAPRLESPVDVEEMTDRDFVKAIRRGESWALAETYRRHRFAVHIAAAALCGPSHADDVVQEVFLRLWRNPRGYDPASGSLRRFLAVDACGRAVDSFRAEESRRVHETNDHSPRHRSEAATAAVKSEVFGRPMGDDVAGLLSTLPDRERLVIVLTHFGGYSYRDVAVMLDRPEGTVKSQIRSGLARLRIKLLEAAD
jgi:RNA polymerase sigma factor (sigma-70 family)